MNIVNRTALVNVADVGDFQAALDRLPATGGALYIPAGTYEIDHPLICRLRESQHLHVYGDGRATVLRYNATERSPMIELDGVPDSWWPDLRITLRDLTFVGNDMSGDALSLRWPNDLLIDSCAFFGFGGTAIRVTPNATNVTIRDCWMRDCKRTLHADNLHHLTFHGNQTRSRNGGQQQLEHLYIGRHCREVRIVNNHLAYGHAEAIILDGTAQHVIANNTIEGFTHGIRAKDCRDIAITGNYIHTPIGVLLEEDSRGIVINANIFTNNWEGAVRVRRSRGSGGHVITANVIRQSVYNDGQKGIDTGKADACVVSGNVLEDLTADSDAIKGKCLRKHALGDNVVTNCTERARKTSAEPKTPVQCAPDHPLRPLHDWLVSRKDSCRRVTMTFWELKRMLDQELPAEASANSDWWMNNPDQPQASAWLAAGWLVIITKRIEGRIVFGRLKRNHGAD